MEIKDCMKKKVFSIHQNASVWEAAQVLIEHHVGLLPVIDDDGKPVGVVGMRDLIEITMPSFVGLIDDVDFVHDFGAMESVQPSEKILNEPVSKHMRPVTIVKENCGLMRAYSLMLQRRLHDLPVVSVEGKLTGIASRVDLGKAILSTWVKKSA
jgi:CBS domain-containing protein